MAVAGAQTLLTARMRVAQAHEAALGIGCGSNSLIRGHTPYELLAGARPLIPVVTIEVDATRITFDISDGRAVRGSGRFLRCRSRFLRTRILRCHVS